MDLTRTHATTTIRTEGGLLPADLLSKVAAGDPDVPGLQEADFGLPAGDRTREAITRSWNRLVGAWASLTAARLASGPSDSITSSTREKFLLPLFEELGFGRLSTARAADLQGYAISHISGQVPVHLVGFDIELDRRTPGVRGAAGAAPHALLQEFLNRSDEHLWGLVSNGRLLRLLRDSTSLTRQAFVEFDLQAILEGQLYADFALLWLVCHRTRFGSAKPADCLLETWMKKASDDGTRALDKLRGGVEHAIEALGAGFLANPANSALREALRTAELDKQDYYRELLRLVYRLIFLFAAEDRRDETTGRELLLDPSATEEAASAYRSYYSTARIRRLASRKRGTRHGDLWLALRRVSAALGGDGAPTLALPALGSFLFGTASCPHLDPAELSNETLLDAVRALATIEDNRRLRTVDYRNLGAEELGGVYESLLELHPRVEVDASPPTFALSSTAGNERKSTGSYYTPSSLINCLLDSALDPVVEAAVRGKDAAAAEHAILGMAIADPAAGSGHFLVSAAHRLAKRLAGVRTGEGEPTPTAVRHALRDVISRCIYAVDVNPMAIELCKVSLWLEALEPGRPLSFLDAHVKVGNSVLGTSAAAVARGIPDEAFAALTGDDKSVVRAWRSRNGQERSGQRSLFEGGFHVAAEELAAAAGALDELPETDTAAVAAKAALHAALLESSDYQHAKLALDSWCSAFVATKIARAPEITNAVVRSLGTRPDLVPSSVRSCIAATASSYSFFHWELEFPAVFAKGGFDVVLGNPPWERVKLQEKEFFAERSPVIADAQKASQRKLLVAALERTDPVLWQAFQAALRQAEGESHLLRNSGEYPLTGRGDINTYAVFAERIKTLLSPMGRAGVILPTGIATDDTTKHFFEDIVGRRSLVSLFAFENEGKLFPAIDHRVKFLLLTLTGSASPAPASDLVFFARQVGDLTESERHFSLSADDFALLNPNTRTCPTFRGRTDAELAKAIYRRIPVFILDGDQGSNPWSASFSRMFDMANDSSLFSDEPAHNRLPLFEAKMIHQFDHRYGTYEGQTGAQSQQGVLPQTTDLAKEDPSYLVRPRYWIASDEVAARLRNRSSRNWLLGWRKITNAVSVRSLIATAMPVVGYADSGYLLFSESPELGLLVANLNAFVLDWLVRQKMGGLNLNLYIVEQLPILPPSAYGASAPWDAVTLADWLRRRVVELVCTSSDMADFGSDLGWNGPPFIWDPVRRRLLRAEIDAAYFVLYGIERSDVERILDSFWIVRDYDIRDTGGYKTRDLVLEAYDALVEGSPEAPFVSRLSPSPGDPAVAHSKGSEPTGHWIPWRPLPPRTPPRSAALAPRPAAPTKIAFPEGSVSSRRAAARPAQVAIERHQQTMSSLVSDAGDEWIPEAGVDPQDILMGARIRHRSRGTGTVLTVKAGPRSCELLINFDSGGEAWIAFGYGVLEFAK